MSKNIRETIINRLHEIEVEHQIEILYAVESGSRAWGFESGDSDWDIRFIYKHKLRWYLNILPKPDVIEYPETNLLDISGWDLRKTLFLLSKSNPSLFEWLCSPIVYLKNQKNYDLIFESAKNYFSPISATYHYLHMAKGNYRDYLQGDVVRIKKYFYVLRPILACMWIEKYSTTPPMNFQTLLDGLQIEEQLLCSISRLIKVKRSGTEMNLSPKIVRIDDFIRGKIEYFTKKASTFNTAEKPPCNELDKLFYSLLI